jgi:hypothetical protein
MQKIQINFRFLWLHIYDIYHIQKPPHFHSYPVYFFQQIFSNFPPIFMVKFGVFFQYKFN